MRKVLTFLSAVFLALPLFAQAAPGVYFCLDEGKTLRYERYDPEGKRHWWTQTMDIGAVRSRGDGGREVDFTVTVIADRNKPFVKGPVEATGQIRPNGDIEIDVVAVAAKVARETLSFMEFQTTGEPTVLPSAMQVGDTLKSVHASVTWKGIGLYVDYYDRRVLRRERLTVPAGTFDCLVVYEHKLEKAPFYKRDRITLTWYAQGIGMVRHDTFLPDGRQESSELLCAIE